MADFVTVCDKCPTAACWQGEFMCDDAQAAGTVEKSVEELSKLTLEAADWWNIDPNTGCAKRCNQ